MRSRSERKAPMEEGSKGTGTTPSIPAQHPYDTTLRQYVKHCKVLIRDIDHVISDHEALQNKWTIHYAVDFSEIFNFVLPAWKPEHSPLSDGWGEDPELQFFVLSRFFAQKNIILPEPYAVELRAFMEWLLANMYGNAAKLFLDALSELRRVLEGKAVAEIERLAGIDRPLTEDETKHIIAFFEAQAPALVAFVRGADLPAADLLKRLLRSRPFVDLESVAVGSADGVDHDSVNRLREFLKAHRLLASNPQSHYNDALAMEQIRVANKILAPHKRKILLVSRSSVMMSACRRYSDHPSDAFIRHPRIFSTAYTPEKRHDERSISDLRRRQQSLDLFAKAVQESLARLQQSLSTLNPDEETDGQQIIEAEQLLDKMRKDWANIEGMSAAFIRAGEIKVDPGADPGSPKVIAHHLLEFLRDDTRNLARQAKQYIQKLIDDVRRQRDVLGVKLQSAAPLQTEYLNLLYPIHFQSKELEDYVVELARHWSVNLDAASALVEKAANATDDEYEQLLAMSVSLGILGLWEVAENYAAYALELGQQDGGQLYEGYFWHAVCVRKNSVRDEPPHASVERIKKAIDEIDKASIERYRALGEAIDARYLKEQGALLIEWRQIASSPDNSALRDSRPSPSAITDTLSRAWSATEDTKLRAQISNALFYHFIAEEDRENAEVHRSQLEESLRRYPTVPSFIRDTRVWGDYFLSTAPTVEQVDTWLKELDLVYNAYDMTPFEKELVQRHRIDVSGRRNQIIKDQIKPLPRTHV